MAVAARLWGVWMEMYFVSADFLRPTTSICHIGHEEMSTNRNRCFIPFKTAIETSSSTSTFDLRPDLRAPRSGLSNVRFESVLGTRVKPTFILRIIFPPIDPKSEFLILFKINFISVMPTPPPTSNKIMDHFHKKCKLATTSCASNQPDNNRVDAIEKKTGSFKKETDETKCKLSAPYEVRDKQLSNKRRSDTKTSIPSPKPWYDGSPLFV
ncbi:hypothetical protein LXL04_027494 [Taraxacum kok-saghyz]